MLNSEDGCIRYLMKEMDPSEEMEFERMMLEDENLLIEVETLRNTLKKMNQLPEISPPLHIIDNIKASPEYRQKVLNKRPGNRVLKYSSYSAAATILILAASGLVYLNMDKGSAEPEISENSSVTPWIDKKEVLRFSGEYAVPVEAEQSEEYNNSYNKLRLVSTDPAQASLNNGLILTGSSE